MSHANAPTRIGRLSRESILSGYDAVSVLYPHVPSLSHWRSWEFAAYREFEISGRVLDLGCGDGKYFRLLWPGTDDVVGVEVDPAVAQIASQSGVYRTVHVAPAHAVPEPAGSFDHVFANCSLEHMDHLDLVLGEIHRCLRPGGTLLCSVVTERFVEWALLPNLVAMVGESKIADALRDEFLRYHHLANPLKTTEWLRRFSEAGFHAEVQIPILPKFNSGIFLLMEGVWHLKQGQGELGDSIHPFLAGNERFPAAFRHVVEGLIDMESDWDDCSGVVFMIRKPEDAA
jgi:SAM-dependent methyltransferase